MNIVTATQMDQIVSNAFAQLTANSSGFTSPLTNGRMLDVFGGKIISSTVAEATAANIKTSFDHAQLTSGNPHNVTRADLSIQNAYDHALLVTGNPHVVTKEDVDMGNTDSPEFAGLIINGNSILDGALQHDGSTAGFYAVTPTTQPAAIADATDAASVITQLNDLLAKLRTLGIIAT